MKRETKLSKHSIGPEKGYSPTPFQASLVTFRIAFSLLGQAVRDLIRNTYQDLIYLIFSPITRVLFDKPAEGDYVLLAMNILYILAGSWLIVYAFCSLFL